MTRTSILLPPELKRRAERLAGTRGQSLAALIRHTLEAELAMQSEATDPFLGDSSVFDEPTSPTDLALNHDAYLYGE